MNIRKVVNIIGPLERDALAILRDIPGVTVERSPVRDARDSDIVMRVGDVSHVVELKVRNSTNAGDARLLGEHASRLSDGTHLVLITRNSTEEARRILEEAGVAIVDAQGNMRIELPGVFVWTEGRSIAFSSDRRIEPAIKLSGKAGIVAQVLMGEPARWWQVDELANSAGVSAGLAHRVLARLQSAELVQMDGRGPKRIRRVSNPTALLDLWAEEMRDRRVVQIRAFRLERDGRAQARNLSQTLTDTKIAHAVTGPAGAVRLAPFITAVPTTDIWITETVDLSDVAESVGAEVVREGHNIVLRQASGDGPLILRTQVEEVWTVNPFRLYFDLRQDPRRGREQADRVREEVIGF